MHKNRDRDLSIAVVVGEPSGDWIAAGAVAKLRGMNRHIRCFGIGGDHMAAAGVSLVQHISSLTALGPVNSLKRAPLWMNAWADFRLRCKKERPKAALLVDCPDITLPLARALKADGVRVLQYMGPKVWAWRKNRLRLLRERTDMVALGFAFEKPLYDEWRVPATFVGHPLLDVPLSHNREAVRNSLHVPGNAKVMALLPGSRASELKYHSAPMLEAAVRLLRNGVVTVFAPHLDAASEQLLMQARSMGCVVWQRPVHDLLAACDGALAASGTVTLELARAMVPMVIVYKMDKIGYWLGQQLLDIPFVGLPNWVAGEATVPELLQEQVTGENLFHAAMQLFTPGEQQRQQQALQAVASKLGTPGAAHRVAQMIRDWVA
ncbi:MAG: lipid-A-disaccharide synthase [Deltaproteobacteria bacterium]|nr:lipid-A-disaccharide synthase [Deltaproteobacteria bacterium]